MKVAVGGKNSSQAISRSNASNLESALLLRGHNLVNALERDCDLLQIVDWSSACAKSLELAKSHGIKSVLVMNEPSVIIPEHGKQSLVSQFDLVIRVGRPGDIEWPQDWKVSDSNVDRKLRAVMINTAKWSFHKNSLYWLRSEIAANSDLVDVFGSGWDSKLTQKLLKITKELIISVKSLSLGSMRWSPYLKKPQHYLGEAANKHQTLEEYKVALVIENSSEFLSEKLIDSILAGCIPVYVGPNPSQFGIPEGLFFYSSPDRASVMDAMDLALASDYSTWLTLRDSWVKSPETKIWWDSASVFERIADRLESLVEKPLQ